HLRHHCLLSHRLSRASPKRPATPHVRTNVRTPARTPARTPVMTPSARLLGAAAAGVALLASAATLLAEARINSGEAGGIAAAGLCPILPAQLKLAQFAYRCAPSAGPGDTIARVLAEPRELGYAPLDAFVAETRRRKDTGLKIVRDDDGRLCLFAVT